MLDWSAKIDACLCVMKCIHWLSPVVKLSFLLMCCLFCFFHSYILRCTVMDDWGRVRLAFDLEVCTMPKTSFVGVCRKRVKGDTWHYKRLCKDIILSSKLGWNAVWWPHSVFKIVLKVSLMTSFCHQNWFEMQSVAVVLMVLSLAAACKIRRLVVPEGLICSEGKL